MSSTVERHPGPALRTGAAAAFYLALTILLTYPLPLQLGRAVLVDDPDSHLFMWTLAWDAHAFRRAPLSIFDANIYYPERNTLAYSENLIGSAIVAAPVIWATGNPVLAMNVVALLSCVLCGVGAYVLARRVGLGIEAALLCGVVFAFSPARFFRISQIHLTTVQWVPFALASLHAYFDRGMRRDLWLAAAFVVLQALTSGHGAVFALVAVGLLAVRGIALGGGPALARMFRDLGIAGLLLLAPLVLIFVPYWMAQKEMGLRRSLVDWAPTPQSFLASPTRLHGLVLSWLAPHVNATASAFLFPGYVPLALALVATCVDARSLVRDRLRSVTLFYFLLTIVAVLLAAGPPIGIWPLVYWIPGLNFIRVPSRFMILAVLGLAVLAAIGFERLAPRVGLRRTLAAVILGIVLLAEFATIPLRPAPYRLSIPPADRWLDLQPKPFVVAEVPVTLSERTHTAYMLHSMAHWQKTVHGYSGLRPARHDRLYAAMRRFPDEESLRSLETLGVTYVVVHTDMYPPGEWESVKERLDAFASRIRLQHTAGAGWVYGLRGAQAER